MNTWTDLRPAYDRHLRERYRSRESIRTRMHYANRLGHDHPDVIQLSTADLQTWLSTHRWEPATRKGAQASLRALYSWLRVTGRISVDPTVDLPAVRVPRRLPRPATEAQLVAGRSCGDPDTELMVRLAGNCGLRRSEIAALRREDLTPWGLRVRGKGDKERIIPLPADHPVAVAITNRPTGWLFPGRFTGHIHPATVQKRIKRATGSSPHPFRARMATQAYAGTKDLFAVQRVLGHHSPETTMAYVALCDEAVAAVVRAAA